MTTSPSPFKTVRDLVRYAVSRFSQAKLAFGHGSDNAFDEAVYLVLHTLHLPLDTLEPFLDARLTPGEIDAVLAVIERRATERVPAAYLTREAWMHGHRFYVDERVIVPRSFIGELLDDGLQPYVEDPELVGSVLELCTGSGCLAILAALAFPNASVDAVDLSADALAVAKINRDDYGLDERIALHHGDLYAPLPQFKWIDSAQRYDVIITNPPYVNAESMAELPAEYRHEPEMALAGGADGMDIVRRIIGEARRWLKDDGVLVVEIGNERANVEAAFGGLELVWLPTSAGDDSVFLIHASDLPAVAG
ncbi:50S ribosomal protein L3 N(5)-glutamine methyltransferase [Burkholderia thailandensis]|uniref:Ribosomal protein uL3 glutamine methyltransferase n=1 Tax=Burkholderia thailandensis (strain ATCC 700388 / DSM 13276 / CCUG 48851 / CIP 106301 / E264) TaxID=271848 RepID=Q2SX12_BURTA|nr:50S ribosomal protein L3 N(5)-glutamine methyltransferase [Burkholderia thailandensis]ABC39099.1 hemK family protein [Burkholderia thailandensis E264]AHI72806.1 (glutamine-N5) methyltransferase, ribosomal protein L3-specific [Burkholderia thailandensis 2002721723]AHI77593.1 (glutamine-N5) methyltransferase, ribosomal protein L3-specific [Burkholderia thailandensis E444]AIC86833.1 (glutamine-N5) methyltransferase, ribosomal protein L3-specific [Burkholderia thailandensis USAMRU Malaysia \